jgi:hypothetical protein
MKEAGGFYPGNFSGVYFELLSSGQERPKAASCSRGTLMAMLQKEVLPLAGHIFARCRSQE